MSNTQVDTPYASFNPASREVSSNGGAWYPDEPATTIIPHQSMGEVSELFQLTGRMEARIVIPRDVAHIGDTIHKFFTFIACEVKMDGDIRDYATLLGSLTIPFCPTMSDTLTLPLAAGISIFSSNPLTFTFFGETVLTKQTTIYLGNFQFSLSKVDDGIPSNAGSSSSTDSNGSGGSTIATSNPTLSNSNATSMISSTGVASGGANGTQSAAGSSTITLSDCGTTVVPIFLTTKDPHYAAPSSARTNTESSAPVSSSSSASEVRIGAIVGGVLGGIILSAIILLSIFFKLRRRRREEEKENEAETLDRSDGGEVQVLEGAGTFAASQPSYLSHVSEPFEHSNHFRHHDPPISASDNPPSNVIDPAIPLGRNPTTSLPGYTPLSYTQPPSYHSRSNPDRTRRLVVASAFASSSSPRPAPAVARGSGRVHGAWLVDYAKN